MKNRKNSYWEYRAQQRMATYHRNAERTIHTVAGAYDKATKDIQGEIDKIFTKFASDGELTPAEAKRILNQPISKAEWNDIKGKVGQIKDPKLRRRLLNRLNAPAYAARISRLEALKANTYIQSKIIADVEISASTASYMDTAREAYYRTLFDIQKGVGLGFDVSVMSNRNVQEILKNPWGGTHFSSRVWANTDELSRQLNEVITAGFKSGIGSKKMAKELQERMGVGKFVAARIIRTETTFMANAAEMESYEEAEIDKYIFVATLDSKTSTVCRDHDRKVYKVKDAVPGENMPPMHPFCRSTTRAYLGPDTLKGIQRRARDPKTGKTYLVPASMNYHEWKEKYVE